MAGFPHSGLMSVVFLRVGNRYDPVNNGQSVEDFGELGKKHGCLWAFEDARGLKEEFQTAANDPKLQSPVKRKR